MAKIIPNLKTPDSKLLAALQPTNLVKVSQNSASFKNLIDRLSKTKIDDPQAQKTLKEIKIKDVLPKNHIHEKEGTIQGSKTELENAFLSLKQNKEKKLDNVSFDKTKSEQSKKNDDKSRNIHENDKTQTVFPFIAVAPLKTTKMQELPQEKESIRLESSQDSKPKGKLSLNVHDLRKNITEDGAKKVEGKREETSSNGNTEIKIVLRDPSTGKEFEKTERVVKNDSNFSNVLERELKTTYNGEIAKSGSIILRNDESALIRLTLKPEHLGNVKLEMNVHDNTITGHIVVDTEEAREVFEKNLYDLAEAFKNEGYDNANFEVSVGSQFNKNTNQRNNQDEEQKPYFSNRLREFNTRDIGASEVILNDSHLNMIM